MSTAEDERAWPSAAVRRTTVLRAVAAPPVGASGTRRIGPVSAFVVDGPAGPGAGPGAGPAPVVCVHGLGGSALDHGLLAPLLATSRPVHALDLLGHGRSPAGPRVPGGAEALRLQVRALAAYLDEAVGEPVVLVGHSLGGVVALLHAEQHPASVRALVLLAPPVPRAGGGENDPRLLARRALLGAPGVSRLVARRLARTAPEQVVARQLEDATPHAGRIDPAAVAATVAETAWRAGRPDAAESQRAQWQAVLGTVSLLARPAAWRRRLTGVAAPVLWLQGDDDRLVDAGDAAALAATRPDWVFARRPGVGHLPHLEDPAWTAERVLARLADLRV